MVRNPDDAVDNGVEMFRLISGPHFDADAARRAGRGGVRPQLPPRRRRPPDDGHRRQPRPHVGPPPGPGPDAGRPRPARPARHAERRHGHGARPIPGAKLVMYPDMGHDLPRPRWDDIIDEITDNARRGRPRRLGRRPRPRVALTLDGRPPHAGRARRRGRAAAGDLDRRRRAHRHRRAAPHHPRRAGLRRADARPPRPARPPRAHDEPDHRHHRRARTAARRGRVPRPRCGRRRRSCCCRTRSPSSPDR